MDLENISAIFLSLSDRVKQKDTSGGTSTFNGMSAGRGGSGGGANTPATESWWCSWNSYWRLINIDGGFGMTVSRQLLPFG